MNRKRAKEKKTPGELLTALADAENNALAASRERGYRQGVRDGKRLQRSSDRTMTLILSSAAALAAQIPYLVLLLRKRKEARDAEKAAERAKEAETVEEIRRSLEDSLSRYRGED